MPIGRISGNHSCKDFGIGEVEVGNRNPGLLGWGTVVMRVDDFIKWISIQTICTQDSHLLPTYPLELSVIKPWFSPPNPNGGGFALVATVKCWDPNRSSQQGCPRRSVDTYRYSSHEVTWLPFAFNKMYHIEGPRNYVDLNAMEICLHFSVFHSTRLCLHGFCTQTSLILPPEVPTFHCDVIWMFGNCATVIDCVASVQDILECTWYWY